MRRLWILLRGLVGIAVVIGAVLFAVSNRNPVAINLNPLPFVIEAPVFLVVLAALLGGVLLAMVFTFPKRLRRRKELKRTRLRNQALENEVASLKLERQAAS